MSTKVHIHDEQFDGHMHAWCGRGSTAVGSDKFEATAPALRCKYCNKAWFPSGQPGWHYEHAVKKLKGAGNEPKRI